MQTSNLNGVPSSNVPPLSQPRGCGFVARFQLFGAGFTLIEMLVVLSVVCILVATALPTVRGMVAAVRMRQAAGDFFSDMTFARSEAIKTNSRVAICKTLDGQQCVAMGGWEHGWMVFRDHNNSGTRELSEEIVKSNVITQPAVIVRGNGNVSRYVSFTSLGTTQLLSGAFQAGTFTICPLADTIAEGRQLIINAVGRVRLAKVPVDKCR